MSIANCTKRKTPQSKAVHISLGKMQLNCEKVFYEYLTSYRVILLHSPKTKNKSTKKRER